MKNMFANKKLLFRKYPLIKSGKYRLLSRRNFSQEGVQRRIKWLMVLTSEYFILLLKVINKKQYIVIV